MATLKVNLSRLGNACDQDPTPAGAFPSGGWYVFLFACNDLSHPLVRAGKQYGPIPMDHGYAEIKDVPAGRYVVFAMENPFTIGAVPIPNGEELIQANFTSHFAIVDVCCGCDDICVKLYNPGWHYCVRIIIWWFELLASRNQLNAEIARPAIDALNNAVKAAGRTLPGDEAVLSYLGQITRTFREQREAPKE